MQNANHGKPIPPKCTRRHWLATSAAGITAALGGHTSRPALAIEPPPRSGPARFQFSLAAYSYRRLLQGAPPKLTMFDFVDDCVRFGLQGTELTSYYFPQPTTDEYLRRLKQHCFRQGIDISGTAIRCDFGVPAGEKRDQEIATVHRWIQCAEILGAPVIRIFAGHQPQGQSAEQTRELIVAGIEECCQYAGDHGVHLALENHGGPTSTAKGLLAIVRDVDSEWFGVNLDTGNFHSNEVYAEIEEVAPYAINVQVKVVVSSPDKKKQPTDFIRLAEILRAAQYRGYVVLEYEEDNDPREASQKYLMQLREAFM